MGPRGCLNLVLISNISGCKGSKTNQYILKWTLYTELPKVLVRNAAKIVVLMYNVGPETFRNLSYICQNSVRKQSVTKLCQISVRIVSDDCQKSVSCKYLSELYQKRFGNPSEMCQIL